eukprot:gene17135-22649_t
MTAFKIFDIVSTVYGPGYIASVREKDYVVLLTQWQLAQGQSPTLYLQEESLKLIPGALPGTVVSTTYGVSKVQQIRGDGVHIVKPINWKLANNSTATLYLQPDNVKLHQTPDFFEGDEVITVYGQGYVDKVRDNDIIVKLNDWKLAQGQSPTLYLNKDSAVKIPGLKIGSVAKTVWGLVRILDIQRDGKHVTEAVHWNLADGKPPKLYLAPEAFALLSIKP